MPIATSKPHPHLPVPLGQLSIWQETTRDHPLLNAGKDKDLPSEADVVIIGSGMCGAVVAHTLLESPDRPKNIVVLEAREICSGASGRNAGHCRPDAARGFTAFSGMHGKEEAKHILSSESEVLHRVDDFVTKHNIECEWTPRPTYDVCMTDEFMQYEAAAYKGLQEAGGKPEGYEVLNGDDARKESRVGAAIGGYKWPAATLNPAKLTLGIHTINSEKGGYELYSWAPVHSVTQADDRASWTVTTPRGSVKAGKVVFATNAYSQAIVPELEGLITPWRAQAIIMPPAPVGEKEFPPLVPSYSLRYLVHNFYSVAPRPDQSVVLGTSRQWDGMPPAVKQSIINTVDDSKPSDEITENAMGHYAKLFAAGGWDPSLAAKGTKQGHDYAWAGIIGMTPDAIPFIGEVPDKAGQYVAAGFNGHGMARIFICAPALAKYMTKGEWDPAMPASFRVTPERLEKLRAKVKQTQGDATAQGLAKLVI